MSWSRAGALKDTCPLRKGPAPWPEQLRPRLTVMYNALAMIKLKHPGRNELTYINADLIEKYKDYLLGDYVYGLRSAPLDP